MTSRYRAAQRAVELIAALEAEGLTTDEIAAELRLRGALDRKGASDPAADLYANVRDMVADFAKATGQPLVEDALRARAGAAEAEVARLRAELKQARAEGEAAGAARERADVAAYLRRHDVVIEDRRAVQSADMQSRLVVVHVVPRDAAADIEAGEHVGAAGVAPPAVTR